MVDSNAHEHLDDADDEGFESGTARETRENSPLPAKKSGRVSSGSGEAKSLSTVPQGKTYFFELDFNLAAALCYLPVLPVIASILWLYTEPKPVNSYLKFHCLQSLFATGVFVALNVVLGTISAILGILPIVGGFLSFLFTLAIIIVQLIFMAFFFKQMVAVFRGKEARLPIVAQYADGFVEGGN